MPCRIDRRGFTLVEMLVVIAIISVLTAISVPTMSKLGMFGRDPLNVAARQTLVMLKAARIYAGTHNVDTAVVYAINLKPDDQTPDANDKFQVIDGMAMVRRLKPEELSRLSEDEFKALSGSEKGNLLPFVPVKDKDGVFTFLPKGAVIARYIAGAAAPAATLMTPVESWEDFAGFCAIRVLDKDLQLLKPRPDLVYHEDLNPSDVYRDTSTNTIVLNGGYASFRFPAHVFKPAGVLQVPKTDMALLKIDVIPAPEAPQNARFLDGGKPVPEQRLEIYSTIGRIQAAS